MTQLFCLWKGRLIMSEDKDKVLDNAKQESENTNSESKKEVPIVESSGLWGKFTKKGNYITFEFAEVEGGIKGISNEFVYPKLKYRKFGSREENGRKIVKLKLVGEQKVEFYEDDLYKQFGIDIKSAVRTQRAFSYTDTEYNVFKKLLLPILRDEKSLAILQSKLEDGSNADKIKKAVNEVKEAIGILGETNKN